jgi:hypothetical protein
MGDRRFRDDKEGNMTVREWLLIPELDFSAEASFLTLQEMG